LGFKTDFNFENAVKRTIQQLDYTTEIAAFFKYKITAGKFLIEPSFRAHYYASLSEFSPEPRLGLKYNLSDKVRLKASGGLYSQNLMSATSNADVVNLFYGFLSGPDNLPDSFNGKLVKSHLQKAYHAIAGIEYSLAKNIEVNIEGYYKNFMQLTNINRNKLYDDTGDNYKIPDYLKKDFVVENGYADGVDFTLKYDTKKIYLWAVYSLSWVRMYDGIAEYYPVYDRRHNVNLLGVYKFGDKLDWEFNARWNFGSGFPFTKTQGFYELINLSDGIMSDYTKSNGDLGILYDSINTGRLPYYHRLDITLKKEFMFSETSKLEVDISITNVYNRKNVFYRNRITNKTVYQLPIIPSISLNFIF
ncbi:MAG: hypothetical protein PHD97_11585, partial [Bacteroidales bacterium]|nr:hypothetical protein [Bacteroidales bacterium]